MINDQITAAAVKPLRTHYKVHQLFSKDTGVSTTQDTFMDINTGEVGDNRGDNSVRTCEVNTLVNVAITAHIEMLEAENRRVDKSINASKFKPSLQIEHIAHDQN